MHKLLQKDPYVWDLFTRKEEYNFSPRDQYGRFPYYLSKNKDIFEPCASKYLIDQGFQVKYPENKPFAVCLTHDIDTLYERNGRKILRTFGILQDERFSRADSLAQLGSKKAPYWNFSDIIALEEHYGAKSSFYFLVQDEGDRDYDYDIEDCGQIMGELSDHGWEVGLHGGHTTYNKLSEMIDKKQHLEHILNKKIIGYRNHFLRFLIPNTWEYLHSAGFCYDATLGYPDCVGFRNGMCHPFKPFNLDSQNKIDILEIPLNIMDGTLTSYMRLDISTSWELTKQLIDTVERYHGVISILWHNENFFGQQRKFYEKILKYCSEKNAWLTSSEEIAVWWKENIND
jgi:hypothetical protein